MKGPKYYWDKSLTKFHEDRKINVASRVLTRFYYRHIRKTAPPIERHTNLLTKLHEDWTINVASRVLARNKICVITSLGFCPIQQAFKNDQDYVHHVSMDISPQIQLLTKFATKTIFELIQDIIGTNLLTKCHDDRKINVTSRVLTRKNAPPRGGNVFQPTGIIF
ncbi:hypothetical protein DPMN_063345 [Dreissena polymorpha]|uniref:Uncharacterized protein n=1 Tax=Dreissena polymorpha TaxID=45954 RepID=A0A9D4CAC2_DREPO|nr:hypothetical protein DPMN_063345 [Dreissena polymorpha]